MTTITVYTEYPVDEFITELVATPVIVATGTQIDSTDLTALLAVAAEAEVGIGIGTPPVWTDFEVPADVATETARATSAENALAVVIAAETTRALAAEADLGTPAGIATETTRATTAEGALAASITTEAGTRASADTALASSISTEATTRSTADSSNATAIANEITRATGAEAAIPAATLATQGARVMARAAVTQAASRRAGLVGAATSPDASSAFPYGQIEFIIGDSIGFGLGSGSFGVTDFASRLATRENRLLGLPDSGLGFVNPGGGGGIFGEPQFSAIGSGLTQVGGYSDGLLSTKGVQLTGTLNSTTAANSLTDNRVFNRVIIFYKIQSGTDGIGVSYTGQGGSLAHTIDPTAAATGGSGSVGFYDSGVITPGGVAPTLSLTRATHVSGAGGTAPTILGVRYYATGNPGTAGLQFDNLSNSGATTAHYVQNRVWESHLGAVAAQVRRVHIVLGVNDFLEARTCTGVTLSSGPPNMATTAATFVSGDVGRPVTGTNIPSGTTIIAVLSATSATLSANPTGAASGTYTLGQIPVATTTANLTTIVSRIRAQAPNVAVTLAVQHHPYLGSFSPAAATSPIYYGSTIVPAFEAVAAATGATFLNLFDWIGSVYYNRSVTDAVTNGTATVTSSTIAAVASDVGVEVSGTNIAQGPVYVGVVNSATSIGLSSSPTANVPVNASGSGTGGTLKIGNDVFGLTLDGGVHLGDAGNSNGKTDGQQLMANAFWEQLGYAHHPAAPMAAQGLITFFASATWVCPATGFWRISAVGAGGGGAGGSTPSSTITQAGSGGGGQGEVRTILAPLTEGVAYTIAVGTAGTGGTGGAAGGHAGVAGGVGGNSAVAQVGGGYICSAAGGCGGLPATASSTTANGAGGPYGIVTQSQVTQTGTALANVAGAGGPGATPGGFIVNGYQGGAVIGMWAAAAGGGSGGAASGKGGGGGSAGDPSTEGGGVGGVSGASSTANGVNGTSAAAFVVGAGGGAGGPAGTAAGVGGNGGTGAPGFVALEKIG